MKSMRRWAGILGVVIATTFVATAVTGCGSGYADTVVVVPPPVVNAAFALDMRINGVFIPEVDVDPGYQQDVPVRAGSNFEILASGPVEWTVSIDGKVVNPPIGTGVAYNGVNLLPTSISSGRFAANASAQGFLSRTSVISITATSLVNPRQEAQINVLLTN
jgi:hypothetical protein